MKNAPNSKVNLDRSIQRYAGSDVRAVSLRVSMANAIVAQMIGQKGVSRILVPHEVRAFAAEHQK